MICYTKQSEVCQDEIDGQLVSLSIFIPYPNL